MTINNQLVLGEVSFGGHRYLATLHYCDDGGNPKKVPVAATKEVAEVFRASLQQVLDAESTSPKSLLGRVTSEGFFFSGETVPVNYSSEKAQQAWQTFLLLTESSENALTIAPHPGSSSHVQLSRIPDYSSGERLAHLKTIREKFAKEGPYVLEDIEKYLLAQMGLDRLSQGVKNNYQLTQLYAAIIQAEEALAPEVEDANAGQPVLRKPADANSLQPEEIFVELEG